MPRNELVLAFHKSRESVIRKWMVTNGKGLSELDGDRQIVFPAWEREIPYGISMWMLDSSDPEDWKFTKLDGVAKHVREHIESQLQKASRPEEMLYNPDGAAAPENEESNMKCEICQTPLDEDGQIFSLVMEMTVSKGDLKRSRTYEKHALCRNCAGTVAKPLAK